MHQSNEMIRERGLQALRKELGQAGMLRFMRHFIIGSGDYTKDRQAWVDSVTIEDIRKQIKARKAGKTKKQK